MKLKKYLQFISESLKEDVESGRLWKLTEDDIRDYLLELTDAGYLVTVTFGFAETITQHHYNRPSVEKEVFTEKILANKETNPAYWIQIEKSRKIKNDDLSDVIKFTADMVSTNANATYTIYDRDGQIGNIDGVVIKGGLFFTDNWNSSEPELLEAEDYIAIFAKQKNSIKATPNQLVEFYGWNVDLEKGGIPYVEIELEDMADYMLSRRSDYKESLVKGQEYMWDYYDITYYYPDRENLFRYDLDKENQGLLVKALIKNYGGFEKFKPLIAKYSSISELEQFDTEQKLVDHLVGERFNKTILNIIEGEFEMNEEPLVEISDTIANWNQSAHCDDNYKEIVDEFDEIVGDEMPFTKVVKEVTKYYTTKDGEKKEYKTEVTYYQIPYDNKWIEDVDSDNLHGENLENLFKEWISEESFNYEMNPRISDYGDVDSKKMNEDIRKYLEKCLNK